MTDAQENIPAPQPEEKENPRLPEKDEIEGRPGGCKQEKEQGQDVPDSLKAGDSSDLFRMGRKTKGRHFTLYLLPAVKGKPQLVISVSKKTGKATDRNRMKRIIREGYKMSFKDKVKTTRAAVVVKENIARLKSPAIAAELRELAGLDA